MSFEENAARGPMRSPLRRTIGGAVEPVRKRERGYMPEPVTPRYCWCGWLESSRRALDS